MKTVTIQIGNTDGKLTQDQWASYVQKVKSLVEEYADEVHFFGGPPCWEKWQNAAWVFVIDEPRIPDFKRKLEARRQTYSQDSVAWTEGETEFV